MSPALDGAWDCHAHVFGPVERYPLHRSGPGTANPDASIDRLLAMHAADEFGHGVLVQPVEYGADHSCLVEALRVAGPGYRGVAMADPELSFAALQTLAGQGVVGLRFMFLDAAGLTPSAERFREGLGWVRRLGLQLRLLASFVDHPELDTLLGEAGDAPVVLEHMALARPGLDESRLEAMLARPNVWLMLSSGQRRSAGPPWSDAIALGRRLAAIAPERTVWGSDWPYLGRGPHLPEGEALALLRAYLPDEAALHRVLVQNPARLYGGT